MADLCYGLWVKTEISDEAVTYVEETLVPLDHPATRLARRLPRPFRWALRQPMFWWWVFAITFVGLTEGLW